MRFIVVAAGKLKGSHLRPLADDYKGRIQRHARCDEVETKLPSELAAAVPPGALCVALEVGGQQLTSTEFSQKIDSWSRRGKGEMAFVIGGAEGIPPELSARADFQLSLSKMTLPHRLARVFLYEQIYRALSILRGEPYARED